MTVHRVFVVFVSGALLTLLPASANAQSQVDLPVSMGQKVRITVVDGRTLKGKVSGLTPQSIELAGTSISATDVQRVQLSDSVWDGAGKGASLGLLLGALAGVGAGMKFDSRDDTSSSDLVLGVGAGVVSGAILGSVVDAMRTKTVYRRAGAGPSINVSPIVSNAGKGAGVQVRW